MSDPYIIRIRSIEKVVDGDTVRVMADLGLKIYNLLDVRINGIDAPESSTEEGKLVRQFVTWWCNKVIDDPKYVYEVVSEKLDEEKFGRVLGDLRCRYLGDGDTRQLSQVLIDAGMVRKYTGGKRLAWSADELARTRDCINAEFRHLGIEPDLPKPKPKRKK